MIIRLLWAILLSQSVLAAGSCTQKESIGMTVGMDHAFVHDGMERTYKMYRPQTLADNAPMVFVLHGMSSDSTWSYMAGFNGVWPSSMAFSPSIRSLTSS